MLSEQTVAVVGAGYVGLPLAMGIASRAIYVKLLERDLEKIDNLLEGVSYIEDVDSHKLKTVIDSGWILPTSNPRFAVEEADVVVLCVPTPLQTTGDPDTSYVIDAIDDILPYIKPGVLIALESTVYPGFTRELGERVPSGVHLSFSPERVDPGRKSHNVQNTPKVVGALTEAGLRRAVEFYESILDAPVIPTSSVEVAEMVKLLENTFRWVNIGFANEMAEICASLGLDVWEVIDAAASKPYGFMPFYPGPGVGGHCIGPDPQYLNWRLRAKKFPSKFIELAGSINNARPGAVVHKLMEALNAEGKALRDAEVLVVGVAYKPNVADTRESPALDILGLLEKYGARYSYYDPLVPSLVLSDGEIILSSTEAPAWGSYDAIVIVTDHAVIDYIQLFEEALVVVDTRGISREYTCKGQIWT